MNPNDNSLEIPPACEQCDLIEELAQLKRQVAILSDLVHTDPLTGIANLRHFLQALEQELERSRRSGQSVCLVMLDLDYFKQVNDSWGHDVGNQALVHVSTLMRDSLRKFDLPCRYGGEEFAIILPHTDLPAGIHVAERLCKSIAAVPMPLAEGRPLSLTASLGVTVFRAQEQMSLADLIREADGFLYRAKHGGRNRVAHPPLSQPEREGAVGAEEKSALFGWTQSKSTKFDKESPQVRRRRKSRRRS